jgi:hypothetical protein
MSPHGTGGDPSDLTAARSPALGDLTTLAADAVPVCVEPVVVVSHYHDATGVQRTVAGAAQAVVVGGIRVETRPLIVGIACWRWRGRRGRWRWGGGVEGGGPDTSICVMSTVEERPRRWPL